MLTVALVHVAVIAPFYRHVTPLQSMSKQHTQNGRYRLFSTNLDFCLLALTSLSQHLLLARRFYILLCGPLLSHKVTRKSLL